VSTAFAGVPEPGLDDEVACASTRRDRGRGDRGAALAEFALVSPLLLMLLLGMFTGGLAFNQKLTVTNGVREGSRFGSTLPVASSACSSGPTSGTINCWLTQVANVTQSASEGSLGSTVPSRSICVAYVYPGGTAGTDDTTVSLRRTASGDAITAGSTCFSDGRPATERRVQISGSRVVNVQFLVGSLTPTLSSDSVTKFEAG
jgi:Flp pilus assembly protein TadG